MVDIEREARLDPLTYDIEFDAELVDATPDRPPKLSASRVKEFNRCPRDYWLDYVSPYDLPDDDSQALRMGSLVHEAIEDVLAEGRAPIDRQDILESELIAALESKPMQILDDDRQEQAVDAVQTAAKFLADRQPVVRAVEKRVDFGIDRDEWAAEATGIMDLVTAEGFVDWKTGSIYDGQATKEKIQGAFYMAAYRHEYGEAPESVEFVYLTEGKVRSVDPSEEVWNEAMRHAGNVVRAEQTGNFPVGGGPWHSLLCPAADGSVANVPFSQY